MAWFDPPLSRKGNRRCPKCGAGQGLYLFLNSRNCWGSWECPECGYRLGLNARRYWMGHLLSAVFIFAPFFPLVMVLLPLLSIWAFFIVALPLGGVAMTIHWWFLSIEVKGKGLHKN